MCKKADRGGPDPNVHIEFEKDYTADIPNQYKFTITFEVVRR